MPNSGWGSSSQIPWGKEFSMFFNTCHPRRNSTSWFLARETYMASLSEPGISTPFYLLLLQVIGTYYSPLLYYWWMASSDPTTSSRPFGRGSLFHLLARTSTWPFPAIKSQFRRCCEGEPVICDQIGFNPVLPHSWFGKLSWLLESKASHSYRNEAELLSRAWDTESLAIISLIRCRA